MQMTLLSGHTIALSSLAHGAFVFGGLLLYFIVTRIRRQRRHAASAFAWVITIALLPYLGILLFLLFGTRKLARPLRPEPGRVAADGPAPPWAASLLAALGLPPARANQAMSLHADGLAAQAALMAMLASARQRILLSTFILGADDFGDAVVSALVQRAAAGVEVCVLLDALALLRCRRAQLQRLRSAGIALRWVGLMRGNLMNVHLNLRHHRKLVVCDGLQVWSGGRNFACEYFIHDGAKPAWDDLSFDLRGALAADAAALFEHDWQAAGGGALAPLPAAPQAPASGAGTVAAQLVPSGPEYAEDNVYALLLAAAFHARERIVAVSPYFVPDDALLAAWRMACRRGVRITLLLPQRSNHRLADWARGRALRDLAEAGAEIFLTPQMNHAKALIIDDALALCGSVNLDGRSLFLNAELMVALYGAAELRWLSDWITVRCDRAQRYQAREPSWLRDAGEGLVRAIGFQL